MGDDQSNWAEMLKTMNKSKSDGRSDLAIGVFERILRANAIARGKRYGSSKTLSDYCMSDWRNYEVLFAPDTFYLWYSIPL